jgi:Glutathione S-transferase, C-terminal domain
MFHLQAAATDDYANNFLPEYLGKIDKFLGANNGGNGFLVGDKVNVE